MRLVGHVERMGEGRVVYRLLVGRPSPRWENNINMYVQKVGHGVWTGSSWLRIGTGGGDL